MATRRYYVTRVSMARKRYYVTREYGARKRNHFNVMSLMRKNYDATREHDEETLGETVTVEECGERCCERWSC